MIDVVNPEVITQRRDRNIIFVQGNPCLHTQRWSVCISPFLCASMIDVVNPEVITQRRDRNIIFVQGNRCLTFASTHLETILQGKN